MSDGWIKTHRKLLDHPRFKDGDWLKVWLWFLLNASHGGYDVIFQGKRITLKPGQLTAGRHQIAEQTGVHTSKVKRIVAMLKSDQQIDQRISNACSLYTISNWEAYQKSDQRNGQPVTSQWPASDQPVTTNQEGKEGKEEGGAALEEEAHIPTFQEFKAAFSMDAIPEDWLKGRFEYFENHNFWIDRHNRLKNWQGIIRSWWAKDRANYKPTTKNPNELTGDALLRYVMGR